MHSFSEYLQHSSPNAHLSTFFEAAGPLLETRLTIENLEFEIKSVFEFEKSLPNSFETHLDLILTGGASAVSQYYQELAGGKVKVLERLKNKLGEEKFQKINEALTVLREKLKEKSTPLNEQEVLDFQKIAGDVITDATIDAAIEGAKDSDPKSGIIGTLKTLWNTLTDNGDPLSILQLVLDVLGLIPGAWGMAADGVNALIYFWNDRPFLGILSLIGAVFPLGGDIVKVFKFGKTAKYADDFVKYVLKTPSPTVTEWFQRVPISNQSALMTALRYVGSKITSAASKVSSVLFRAVDALSSWLSPFPGLQAFFKGIATRFENLTKRFVAITDGIRYLPNAPLRGGIADIIADLTQVLTKPGGKAGGKLALDSASDTVRLYDDLGRMIREFPAQKLLTEPSLWTNNPAMRGLLTVSRTPEEIVKFYNTLPRVATVVNRNYSRIWSYLHKGTRTSTALALLIGKLIIKAATGKSSESLGIPDEIVQTKGTDAWNEAVRKKIEAERAAGAKYVPSVTFDSESKEDLQTLTDYQNSWAKTVNAPQIILKAYDEYGDPILKKEYEDFMEGTAEEKPKGRGELARSDKDFWKAVAKGEVTRDEAGNLKKGTSAPASAIVQQVPDLKKTDWYQEAFSQTTNESVKVLSFDKFLRFKK